MLILAISVVIWLPFSCALLFKVFREDCQTTQDRIQCLVVWVLVNYGPIAAVAGWVITRLGNG